MPPPLCGGCTARRNAQRWHWTHPCPPGTAVPTGWPARQREIEAVRQENGAPAYRFSGATAHWVADHGLTAHLSLSHDGGMALAFCILETAPET